MSSVVFALTTDYDFEIINRKGINRILNYDWRVHGVDNRIKTISYLVPPEAYKGYGAGRGGQSPRYPRGTARILSVTDLNSDSSIIIKFKDLPNSERTKKVYEAWLVDEDTGYRLSLGIVNSHMGGIGELRYSTKNTFDNYDTIEVTEEPYYDYDLNPGPVVLIGSIRKDYAYYKPTPRPSLMIESNIQQNYLS
ncbi:hypothetical protein DRJ22_03595 [Candidatus Woesearchaeota archaeon]|nr:MAG: hypothetical protein DRJ22_03595 [Candidatus Woesearchaeota archaeon]